jgi:hypothetical protein
MIKSTDYIKALGRTNVWLTVLCFGAGIALFYSLDWWHLRLWTAEVLAFCLRLAGFPALCHETVVSVGSLRFAITSECTYIDWILCSAPLICRPVGAARNCRRVGLLVVLVLCGNLLRIFTAVALSVRGHPWWLVHDWPDYVFWYPALVFAGYRWLMALKPQTVQPPVAPSTLRLQTTPL